MSNIVWFSDRNCTNPALVGGKAANLGLMTAGGFSVPAGFVVTTQAYLDCFGTSDLSQRVVGLLKSVDYSKADSIESATAAIRDLIVAAPLPQSLASAINAAYDKLGNKCHVAVRSSGAAEDLAEASFAGLHDTYLDIQGRDALLDAVRRCWASVWTARAVSYRHTKGFDHFQAPIAVVVQIMVQSEVSGVMFTANPMTTATDEIFINASWGLGEAIVSGITTPDAFVVKKSPHDILEKTLGSKSVQVVRNPVTGAGTITQDVSEARRAAFSLSDAQIEQLADLGLRIQTHYEDFPQDIEWGYADGSFYVLQARPITGVELSWDAEVNASVPGWAPDDQLWSRAFADEAWTGGVTPLMFSSRGLVHNSDIHRFAEVLGLPHLDYPKMRPWQFHKGKAYFNPTLDMEMMKATSLPELRPALLSLLPKSWHAEALAAPLSHAQVFALLMRQQTVSPEQGLNWPATLKYAIANDAAQSNGLSDAALRALSDEALKSYIHHMTEVECRFTDIVWTGLMIIFRNAISLLATLTHLWYDGDNPGAFTDLITGTRARSLTAVENLELWKLSERIRHSAALLPLFRQHEAAAFFEQLQHSDEGREFLKAYEQFLVDHGHRGHADRDLYYIRRAENPAVDYGHLKTLLSVEVSRNPEDIEHAVNERHYAASAAVIANIRQKPMGDMKADCFALLLEYIHKCIVARDDERHFLDRSTFAIKKGYREVNRRIMGKGLFDSERDYFFLTEGELFEVLDGQANLKLAKAKIAARMRDFDRVDSKEVSPPYYIQCGKAVDIDTPVASGDGVLRGAGTSRGCVTGQARVIKNLKDIGRVQAGEILITNSTDPGWTPVFMIIKGIVLETGGMLAHGSLLAREYGFPAVQIDGAMKHIPDGATITVNGDSGVVTIADEIAA